MQVLMDLPDFIPEEYTLRLSIDGRKYTVCYGEARVDEVLPLMADAEKKLDREQMEYRRRVVTRLFVNNLVEGDPGQLERDLRLVPYRSMRDSLDIYGLYLLIGDRVKKKPETGVRKTGLLRRLFGSFGR